MLSLQMLDSVVSMHHLQSQLRSRRCFPRTTGATSKSEVTQSSSKKVKISPLSSSASLPADGSPNDHGLSAVKINGFCDETETARCTTRPEEPEVTSILFPNNFTVFSDSCKHWRCTIMHTCVCSFGHS